MIMNMNLAVRGFTFEISGVSALNDSVRLFFVNMAGM